MLPVYARFATQDELTRGSGVFMPYSCRNAQIPDRGRWRVDSLPGRGKVTKPEARPRLRPSLQGDLMLKTISQYLMAATLALGLVASSVAPADAGRGGRIAAGVAAGIIGLGILGAYAHSRDRYRYYGPACYRGPRECGWVGRSCYHNSWGDYVCRGGRYACSRRTYCD